MTTVTVYPTSRAALSIKHPINGALIADGSQWTRDGFTARMLTDGAVTLDKDRAWRDTEPPIRAASPPEQATSDQGASLRTRQS
jgi:hypothetical protein